jgi:hypothetical protein
MANITIGVVNPPETEKATAQVPNDVPVGRLTEAIVDSMGLPLRGQDGRRLRYHLSSRDRDGNLIRLNGNQSLKENEVGDGDVLQLTVEMVSDELDARPFAQESYLTRLSMQVASLERIMREQSILMEEYRAYIEDLRKPPPEPQLGQKSYLIHYLDFDLTFDRFSSGDEPSSSEYRVAAQWVDDRNRSDANHRFEMPIDRARLKYDYLLHMKPTSQSGRYALVLAKDLGRSLFQTVFAGAIRVCFNECQSRAYSARWGIRIRLDFSEAPELIDYPWEFIWNEEEDFFAMSSYSPVVRYLRRAKPAQGSIVTPPLEMLVVTASPPDHESLDVTKEEENLKQALSDLTRANLLNIRTVHNATPAEMSRVLAESPRLNILHYIGHGGIDKDAGGQGYLALEDDISGKAHRMDSNRLSVLLRDCRQLELVTLNTCQGARPETEDPFASVAMGLTRANVPAVVAMQDEIDDETAIEFSRLFYGDIAKGYSIYEAISRTRKTMYTVHKKYIDWAKPALYSRSPDGIIFKRPEPAAQ